MSPAKAVPAVRFEATLYTIDGSTIARLPDKVRWVNATQNSGTRQRRVEVSISKMQSGKRRPCCFNLATGTDPDLSKNGKLINRQ